MENPSPRIFPAVINPRKLGFGMLESRNRPPTTAQITYSTLPMFIMMGPSVFA